MGYFASTSAVATEAIGPGPRAKKEGLRFTPDYAYQQKEIERVYLQSSGRITYLGDWHSHPGLPPYPSALDLRTARKIANTPSSRAPNPVMFIVGYDADMRVRIEVYRYLQNKLRPCRMWVFDQE